MIKKTFPKEATLFKPPQISLMEVTLKEIKITQSNLVSMSRLNSHRSTIK
jgi:hypothetical protein